MAIPERITAKIGKAVLARLVADVDLVEFFSGGIEAAEEEDIFLRESITPPGLGVILGPIEHRPFPSERWDYLVVTDLLLVQVKREARETTDFERASVIDHMRVVLWGTENGVLRDDGGNRITEALTVFQRLERPIWFPGQNRLHTTVRVAWSSYIGATMEFEG